MTKRRPVAPTPIELVVVLTIDTAGLVKESIAALTRRVHAYISIGDFRTHLANMGVRITGVRYPGSDLEPYNTPPLSSVDMMHNLIESIQQELWGDGDGGWNPDKEWDSDTVDNIARYMREHDFGPPKAKSNSN